MGLENADTATLEAILTQSPAAVAEDPVAAWFSDLRITPGRHAALPTAEMYVLYRRWCQERNQGTVAPFTFARRVRAYLGQKRGVRFNDRVRYCYSTDRAAARLLRAESVITPATPADHALFSFAQLRKVPPKDTRL